MPEDKADKALALIRIRGPVIPADIAKHIGTDILIASAVLSELVSKGRLNISSVKVGGSPLYYVSGQEEKLQAYTSHLHEKEQKAYALLKEQKVLRDKEQTPVIRVALRVIKDFAKPLTVRSKEYEELFWKFHTLPNEEAEPLIKQSIGITHEPKKEESLQAVKQTEARAEQKTLESRPEIKKEASKKITSDFLDQLTAFFNKNNIEVVEQRIIKKKSEIDFIIRVPSPVGKLLYYCKAKNKKRSTDADLSTAYVQGQSKKLSVLYLTTGELSKKAKAMLENEFKDVSVKRIE